MNDANPEKFAWCRLFLRQHSQHFWRDLFPLPSWLYVQTNLCNYLKCTTYSYDAAKGRPPPAIRNFSHIEVARISQCAISKIHSPAECMAKSWVMPTVSWRNSKRWHYRSNCHSPLAKDSHSRLLNGNPIAFWMSQDRCLRSGTPAEFLKECAANGFAVNHKMYQ